MIRNVSPNNTAVEKTIEIPVECKSEFVKAMKIGYYKEFHKQGLITNEQLEQLISLQSDKAA
ncbi:MAG: hypothetical protein NC299_14325 [Lachnospiraceae bacterium]|nr:hypothetical protein [Ruminococcus sp.]MCM1276513.1 hypothetical protein [Lachnospiraceae bacterium]